MFFKKFFIGVLLVCGVITNSVAIEEPTTEEYTMLKFFQQVKTGGDVSKVVSGTATVLDLTDVTVVEALLKSQVDTYKELTTLYNSRLSSGKTIGLSFIKDAQKDVLSALEQQDMTYSKLQDQFKNFTDNTGAALDFLGACMDAYSAGENIGRLLNGDGSVAVNSLQLTQNAYGIITSSATVIAALAPQGTIASTKFVSFYKNASSGFTRSNLLLLALQLNSMAYSAARDSIIEDTKAHFEKEFSAILSRRNSMLERLLAAYRENSDLTQADIGIILQNYIVFSEKKSSGGVKTVVLKDIFSEYMTNGSKYLQDKFTISDSSSLSGFYKVAVALDALAYMSLLEDGEFVKRLDTTIQTSPNWAASVENWLAGAFSGEDAYKIFSTEDMKKKMIPSEVVPSGSDIIGSRLEYYQLMYFNIFAGNVGQEFMEYASQIGEAVKNLKEKTEEVAVETVLESKLLFTLPENTTAIYPNITAPQGETLSFTPAYTAKEFIECVNTAKIEDIADGVYYTTANADLKWKLWYRDDTTGLGGMDINLQRNGNSFSFVSPKSTPITIYDLTYSTDGKQDQHSCPLPNVWESSTSSTGGGDAATHPVKQTGQTISYAAFDDGHYRAGSVPSYSRSTAGVVTDNVTKLEWQDDYSDNSGSIKSAEWQGALDYCAALGLDGGGWRLPSIEELASIVDDGKYSPSVTAGIFTEISSSDYWSSTAYASNSERAWIVGFYGGYSRNYGKAGGFYVRCVRGGL